MTRGVIQAERQILVTQAMDLTPEEMQGFWPLYRDYRLEAAKVGDRVVALIATYADRYENLTDALAVPHLVRGGPEGGWPGNSVSSS